MPVVLAAFPDEDVDPGSHVALLGRTAPRLDSTRPLLPQLEHAMAACRPDRYARISSQVTSVPGQARYIFRRVIYRHLDLAEPPGVPVTDPVPLPRLADGPDGEQGRGPVAC